MFNKTMFFYILAITLLGFSSTAGAEEQQLFSRLISSGRSIFSDLRELVFIVAGFGIIAVGVGGIFGNLNWKWLGAIIVSLVVIATAGELIKVMVGAENTSVDNTITDYDNAITLQ